MSHSFILFYSFKNRIHMKCFLSIFLPYTYPCTVLDHPFHNVGVLWVMVSCLFEKTRKKGNKGGRILLYRNFRYQKHSSVANKIYWRCWREGCHAPLHTNYFNINDDRAVIIVLKVHLYSILHNKD